MIKSINLDGVSIPVSEYASQGNAFLGIKKSGKTYGATLIAERLLEAGVPFIAFDPIGVWRNLKVPGRGDGYKVVVAHPENGDLPLTPESAPEIVRAAMRENIPLVIDLYSLRLSKSDWKRIVEQSIRLLLYENGSYGLRHIFIEEAAEFCPQKVGPDQGRVYAEIEKLARMGGNASLGYTLINQRSEEVNKAVLELCDCLFLHRQKGRNSLTALGKWLDFSDKDMSREIVKSLPTLPAGECWAWLSGAETAVRIKFPQKNSFHPDREHPKPAKVGAGADVSKFVETLSGSLAKHIEKVKENDPEALRKRIRELEKGNSAPAKEIIKEVPMLSQQERGTLETLTEDIFAIGGELNKLTDRVKELTGEASTMRGLLQSRMTAGRLAMKADPIIRTPPLTVETMVHRYQRTRQEIQPGYGLSKCERSILTALAQYPQGRTANQAAILSGYSVKSGGFNNALSKLRSSELITRDQPMQITESGKAALGEWRPLPVGRELAEHWISRRSKCESLILETLVDCYPEGLSATELGERTGYQPSSGGFNNSLSKLRTLELITRGQPIKASEDFFQ